ncbi:MAG: hypothetical protein JST89_22345 [Cyanobacteria bacterium SZAS-4]|nr:hypothetical protein [Cyanobacteria bacterium SZAS-4]
MRAALLSGLISISMLVCQAAQAKSQLDSATLKQLTMLEQKFFGHTYDNETDDDRAQRIEKLILGSASEGAAAARIKKLASITYLDTRPDPVDIPVAPAAPVKAAAPSVATPAPVPIARPSAPAPVPVAKKEAPRATAPEQIADDSYEVSAGKPGADTYPHVTSLEKEILGASYVGQPLSARIVRMETKAFGAPSKSDDLGERTDNLEQFAEQKLHKKPFLADEVADSTIDQTPSPERSQGDGSTQLQSAYPHITDLENSILGQASPSLPLEKRLSAMEVKAFGSVSKSDDLSSRTDALEKYAEKTLHKKPYGADLDYETAESAGTGKAPAGKGKNLLSMVGNSLLGMSGMNAMNGFTGGMGPGGFGIPGVGMLGPGGSGFSGMRVRRRQAPQDEPSAAEEPSGPIEDPLVRAKDPPPASARLATRVGWCEMHVFGKTSVNLHLAERLTQLNRELNFEPGKGPMELMDHIDGLVKSAQAYKAPAATGPAIGATPNAGTH